MLLSRSRMRDARHDLDWRKVRQKMTDTKVKSPNKPDNPPEPKRPADVDPKGIVDAPGRQDPPPPPRENPPSGGD